MATITAEPREIKMRPNIMTAVISYSDRVAKSQFSLTSLAHRIDTSWVRIPKEKTLHEVIELPITALYTLIQVLDVGTSSAFHDGTRDAVMRRYQSGWLIVL